MPSAKKLIALDIDMTLANNLVRLKSCLKPDNSISYDLFYQPSLVLEDSVIPGSVEAVKSLRENFDICFLSARPESVLTTSIEWLNANDLILRDEQVVHLGNSGAKVEWAVRQTNFALLIDDFKYDYQSDDPKLNLGLLEQMDAANVSYLVFDGNWDETLDTVQGNGSSEL